MDVMDGEFNELSFNNTAISFDGTTLNVETSDELDAPLMYQDKMGTNYSKRKKAIKRATIASGITLIMTAAAIRTGTLISNGFVLNPPKISNNETIYTEGELSYKFTVENKNNYAMTYQILFGKETILKEDCSESANYAGTYNEFTKNGKYKFKITFTNSFDYKKDLYVYSFEVRSVEI